MIAKSIKGKSPEEIKIALEQSMADGFIPTLAVVFISVKQDIDAICAILDKEGIAIYGATTNGEFIDGELESGSIAILLLDMNKSHFTIFFDELADKDPREVSKAIAQKALNKFSNPAFLIAGSHMTTNAEELLFGFEDVVGKNVNLYGAMAGDDLTFTDQYVFTNDKKSNQGIVTVVLDADHIIIKGRATCGWKAIGTEKTITKSEGNRVYTIDNIPALDITAKYGGLTNVTPENKNLVLEIASSLPLQLQRESGSPVMRPGLIIHWEDHSFTCSASMPQGSKVRFSLPPDFDVIEEVIRDSKEMKENEMPDADAVIIYSCVGRSVSLGPLVSREIEGLKEIWKVPMVGFFSNAELARATNGRLEMHSITSCCVALKEK